MISVQLAFGTAELAAGAGPAAAAAALCIWALSRSVSGGLLCADTEVLHTSANPIDTTVQNLSFSILMTRSSLDDRRTVRLTKSEYDVGKQ
jgi:hypothetical protein